MKENSRDQITFENSKFKRFSGEKIPENLPLFCVDFKNPT